MAAAKRIIHVTPESYQDDISELRSEIAEHLRNDSFDPSEDCPTRVLVSFLADHGNWRPQSMVEQQGSAFVSVFREWRQRNRSLAMSDSDFQFHLRKFLHATALSYAFNPETSSIAAVHGLRVSETPNSAYDRRRFLEILKQLTWGSDRI